MSDVMIRRGFLAAGAAATLGLVGSTAAIAKPPGPSPSPTPTPSPSPTSIDAYTKAETDALIAAAVAGSPWQVEHNAGWPAERPVPASRPVQFVGPDAERDTVPVWAVDYDTYLGHG